MKTKATRQSDIKRNWHLIDVKGKTLGRVSTLIAEFLIGSGKPYFVSNLDCGDYVVVINASKIGVSGKKEEKKKYYHHSGYPGGFREITFNEQMEKDPTKIIYHAVSGMLPKNKLHDRRLARLKIFAEERHPYLSKFK